MTSPAPRASPNSRLRGYLRESRDPINSLVLVAPLFVIYQLGILFTDGWRNGADFLTGLLFELTGGSALIYALINLTALAVLMGVWVKRRQSNALGPYTWLGLVVESTVYALLLGGLVSGVLVRMGLAPQLALGVPPIAATAASEPGPIDSVVLSLGAGTWEELFFRLIVMGGMLLGLRRTRLGKPAQYAISLIASSLIFSAAHYVPFGTESWGLWSFAFRFLLGVLLAVIYLTRGFAVAVYTHAIYDILILVPRSLGLD